MSNFLIAGLCALSAGAWVYPKLLRRNGGNTQNALIGATAAGFFAFLIVFTILSYIF